jgi:3-hydroxyisobutyrate dehydrogenase
VTRDFEPGFKAAHLLKDLRNILRLAEEENLMLPGAALIHELYLAVMAKKEGEKGTQVLARVLERLAEREINSTKTS